MRCAVRDMEEEDIGRFFDTAAEFICAAADSGGAALVHCHEGKSRSVTLVLAYFMQAKACPHVPPCDIMCIGVYLECPHIMAFRSGSSSSHLSIPISSLCHLSRHIPDPFLCAWDLLRFPKYEDWWWVM